MGLYQNHVDSGGNGFVMTGVFAGPASLLFAGFTVVIAGILVLLAAVWVLGSARASSCGIRRLGGHVTLPAIQLANLTMGLAIINLVMVLAGTRDDAITAGPGLYVVAFGGLMLCLGMFTAVRTRRDAPVHRAPPG